MARRVTTWEVRYAPQMRELERTLNTMSAMGFTIHTITENPPPIGFTIVGYRTAMAQTEGNVE